MGGREGPEKRGGEAASAGGALEEVDVLLRGGVDDAAKRDELVGRRA